MSKTLENLSISGAQLEVLRDSKPYGHAYFDVESAMWMVDFYVTEEGKDSMFIRFIKEMLSGPEVHTIDAFELYIDNMFAYALFGVNGAFGAGRVQMRPIKAKENVKILQ